MFTGVQQKCISVHSISLQVSSDHLSKSSPLFSSQNVQFNSFHFSAAHFRECSFHFSSDLLSSEENSMQISRVHFTSDNHWFCLYKYCSFYSPILLMFALISNHQHVSLTINLILSTNKFPTSRCQTVADLKYRGKNNKSIRRQKSVWVKWKFLTVKKERWKMTLYILTPTSTQGRNNRSKAFEYALA